MSGSKGSFTVRIAAVDAATKQIDAINKRIRAMQAPVEQVTKSLGRLADTTGLTRLTAGMKNLAGEAFSAFQNIGRIGGPMGALIGGASIAGLIKLTTSFGDFALKTQNAAVRAGMSSTQFITLGNAARLAGSSAEAMGAGVTTLKDNLFDIAAGHGSPEAIAAFNTMGIAVTDANGKMRDSGAVLDDLANYLEGVKDPTMRARLEMATLGQAGVELDPMLRRGAKGMHEMEERARKLYGVTDKQVEAAAEFRKKQEELTLATEGLGVAIAAELLPEIGRASCRERV